jgi:threonine aldolase
MPIDLRSDTVTRPTPEMRRAMAEAEVGDDVWGDDPTVRELERETAHMLGKEAAVYVPSGTMGNQISVRVNTRHGDEILLHEEAHIIEHEQGGAAALAGVQTRLLPGAGGVVDLDELRRWLKDPADYHHARQSLLCLENTHGNHGGRIYPRERFDEAVALAREHGPAVHVDGARIWNASVATGRSPAELAAGADTVSVCFSKGLGAPIGSAVAGSAETVDRARRVRKLLGGGMRQAGIVAAGALHALRHHVERLADDHRNARVLAGGLAGFPRVTVDPQQVETNIVLARLADDDPASAPELVTQLGGAGVLCASLNDRTIRFVTHLDVDRAAVEAALERAGPVLS